VQIANEGGLLPKPITRDSFEIWPAKRKEFIVDFTRYMDGYPTRAGDVIWMVNTMKMTTGRLWDSADAAYKVPMMKIVIEGEPPEADKSVIPRALRAAPDVPANAATFIKDSTVPTFELQRGSAPDPLNETEWLINGLPFNPDVPLITVKRGSSGYWRIRNGGGGWVHPMHLHQEEHMVIARNGRTTSARHPDDTGKEDVVALDPSEEVLVYRSFRTFTGPYVAHCHNLAHEDHNMMFGWEIVA
jgi:FtsP/CotA-like multicopper oxidase with cupredoxin domain